jgi:hypothetical protein
MVWGEWVAHKSGLGFVPITGEYLRLSDGEGWFEVRAVVRNVDTVSEAETEVYAVLVDKTMVLKIP